MNLRIELTTELKSTIIHVIAGILIGYISSTLSSNWLVLFMMLVALIAIGQLSQKLLGLADAKTESGEKKYDKKWWLGNGVWPYIAFWLFTWIFFYNL